MYNVTISNAGMFSGVTVQKQSLTDAVMFLYRVTPWLGEGYDVRIVFIKDEQEKQEGSNNG